MYSVGTVRGRGLPTLVVEPGDSIVVGDGEGGQTRAAAIPNPTDAGSTQAAVISILNALRGVGVIAGS